MERIDDDEIYRVHDDNVIIAFKNIMDGFNQYLDRTYHKNDIQRYKIHDMTHLFIPIYIKDIKVLMKEATIMYKSSRVKLEIKKTYTNNTHDFDEEFSGYIQISKFKRVKKIGSMLFKPRFPIKNMRIHKNKYIQIITRSRFKFRPDIKYLKLRRFHEQIILKNKHENVISFNYY